MEAFEEGVKLPSVYVIFYDYFVKSSVEMQLGRKLVLKQKI